MIGKGLKQFIKDFIRKEILDRITSLQNQNVIEVIRPDLIAPSAHLSNSKLKGHIEVGANAAIMNSELYGKVKIGESTKVFKAYLNGNIQIGNHSSVWGPNCDMYSKINPITIGSFCSIARNVSFQEYNHLTDRLSSYFIFQNVFKEDISGDISSKGSITIGNDVWIGAHAVILSGAKIGNGAVVAANSVVGGEVPAYAIVGGVPAKVIKYRFTEEIISQLESIAWWTWPLEKIKKNRNIFEGPFSEEKLEGITDYILPES